MRVLVTGGSGYVGSYIVQALIKLGHEVISLSRRPQPLAMKSLEMDLGSMPSISPICDSIERCDAIVHAAAAISRENWRKELIQVNCNGTQTLVHLAAHWKISRFIYISGVSVIGIPKITPIDECHPVKPESVYLATKAFGEYLTNILHETTGIPALSLRLTSPVGPLAPKNRIFSTFVSNALRGEPLKLIGQGTRLQNYVDVRDVANLISKSLDCIVSGVVNVGGEKAFPIFL